MRLIKTISAFIGITLVMYLVLFLFDTRINPLDWHPLVKALFIFLSVVFGSIGALSAWDSK